VIAAPPPDLARLAPPYPEYDAHDVAHRIVYVEASRGCPFECEFCLSSLDEKVRAFPLEPFLAQMDALLARGVLHFKFVDRTFNLSARTSASILEFFLARVREGLLLHFEMIPDRLPDALRGLLARFPPGAVQLEVGIQTFDEPTLKRISRVQDGERVEQNLRWLRTNTGAHLHADLIAGLPGEDAAGFARGFDRLVALGPHEIHVGILKRLRGTPITRHDGEHAMVWAEHAPYEVLATRAIPFRELQRLRRFARTWDLVGNSGNFVNTTPLLWRGGSPFAAVMRFADALGARTGALHGVALHRLAELLFEHLVANGCPREEAGQALWSDYARTRPHDWPEFLREWAPPRAERSPPRARPGLPGERQRRHR
jgi:hypothetical protein